MITGNPFVVNYGTGAPGGTVPTNGIYFDTSQTPYLPYIFHSGAWQTFGGGGAASGNATKIQGIAISPATPTNGQVLAYNSVSGLYEPTAGGGGAVAIVQSACIGDTVPSAGVTFATAPTKNNVLIAFISHFNSNPATAAGWLQITNANGSVTDGYAIYFKVCKAGESVNQSCVGIALTGTMAIYEVRNFHGIDVFNGLHDVNAAPSIGMPLTTTGTNELIIGAVTDANNVALPTSFTNATQDNTAVGSSRSVAMFHAATTTVATYTPTATYGATRPIAASYCAIF